ncbi:MAG: hypothetical protein WD382_06440 [Halofilum sp. (in: g-proteobacteria)]
MKRLLFFPGYRMLGYEWERGRFLECRSFEPDEAGREAFRAWLAQAPRAPLQLMLDVIEEEFHVDHVPHVIGRDRSDLHRRTLDKHFRQNEFRYLVVQGREPVAREGVIRRDDRVLVAGLTNPDLLRGWLTVLEDARVPLKSIHSLPLVGEQLLPKLDAARSPRALVISQQIPSTLRQSYYEDGRLRFSRLVPGRYEDAEGYADFLQRELRQTLHFLETHRFRRREDPVEVFVICDREAYHALRDRLASTEAATCRLVSLSALTGRVGIRGGPESTHADLVFAHTLLSQPRPDNHYGVSRLRRHFFVQRGRLALQGLATVLVIAALALAGGSYVQGRAYVEGAQQAQQRAGDFERLYQQRLHQLDAFDHRAVDVKRAVDLMAQLEGARQEHPGGLMAAVGHALSEHDDIVLANLRWRATQTPLEQAQPSGTAWERGAQAIQLAEVDAPLRATARIDGEVVGFGGDYRRGVETFEGFIAALRAVPSIARVTVVAAPFDIDSDAAISGDSGTAASSQSAQSAEFALTIQGRSDDETAG